MNTRHQSQLDHSFSNQQFSLIGHGSLVIVVSLIAAFFLTFDMLNGIKLWPFINWEINIPGSVRGWRIAHTGGLLNGIMMIAFALCLNKINLTIKTEKFVAVSFILTGWGNTLFYWFGNFAANRGLSGGATPYGDGDLLGLLAYLSGASVMLLTLTASLLVAKSAFSSKL